MRLFFMLVFSAVFSLASSNIVVGSVENIVGNVKVKFENSIKKERLNAGYEIKTGDLITTSKKASALIRLADGSDIVLDESSSIHFKSTTEAQQSGGKIYYKITSRNAKNSLKITTPFAIIGIKGTTFIVNATDNASVSLKEGVIGIQSIKEEFELYRKQVEEEFNNFKSDQISEFEKFKSEQNDGVAQITKEFDLEAGNHISFSKNRVEEKSFSEDDDSEFRHFEELLNSMK